MIKRTLLSARATGHAIVAVAIAAFAVSTAAAQELSPKLAPYADIQGAEKVSLRLLDVVNQAKANKSSLGKTWGEAEGTKAVTNSVSLELVTGAVSDQLLAEIKAAGVTVKETSERFRRVIVTTSDPTAVERLAAISGVRMVRTPSRYMTHAGSVEGLADVSMNSNVGSAKYGLTGAGTRVGVLSDSFTSKIDTQVVMNSSRTTVTFTAQPNLNYTVVVQSPLGGEFALEYAATGGVLLPPDEETGSQICATRIAIEGPQGTKVVQTMGVDSSQDVFLSGSCAPGNANNFRSFGFKTANPANVTLSIDSLTERTFYISVRPSCQSLSGEVCAGPSPSNTPPLIGGSPGQLSGDLPDQVFVLADISNGTDEGRAMAELIHDVAPGASIAFHTAASSEASFATGILKLGGHLPSYVDSDGKPAKFPCDVIVDDVIYYREPVYQTGIIAWAVEEVVNPPYPYEPVSYFSAAGNGGNTAIRSLYTDVSPGDELAMPPKGKDLHRWPNGTGFLPITVPPKEGFFATLQWNQPSESTVAAYAGIPDNMIPVLSARIDLDMYVTYTPDVAGLTEVYSALGVATGRFSKELQGNNINPRGDAYEEVRFYNESEVTKTVYIAIDHFDGSKGTLLQTDAPLEFTLNFVQISDGVVVQGLDRNNPASGGPTIFGHATAKGALAVGAINYFDTPNFDINYRPTAAIDPEQFTAKGGQMTTFFDASGAPVRRSTFVPQIAAPDGNNTTFFGGLDFDLDDIPNFFGTSAAAPNAAAVAALMLQLNPSLNPEQVTAALQESATDVTGFRAAPGYDDTTGAGLVNALKAFDYVAANYGVGVGPGSSHTLVFNFADAESWQFQAPSGFTAPTATADGHSLVLAATNNTNTLGWWRSPEIISNPIKQPSLLTINGKSGSSSLYRAIYVVSNGTASQADTPAFRFRTSSRSFEQTAELLITSTGNSSLVPAPGVPKSYRHYFTLPATQTRFRLYFDLLGFSTQDSASGSVSLENVQLDAFDLDIFGSGVLLESKREKLYLFPGNANGWTAGTAGADLAPVASSVGQDGITLGPASNPTAVNFGFYSSPLAAAPAVLERNRLYCARYRIKSDIPSNNRQALPSFRLRMNDSSNQMAALVNVNSTALTSETPSDEGYVDYRLYFETPDELIGNKVRLSLDYIYAPGVGDDPTQKITLQALSLDSYFGPISN